MPYCYGNGRAPNKGEKRDDGWQTFTGREASPILMGRERAAGSKWGETLQGIKDKV